MNDTKTLLMIEKARVAKELTSAVNTAIASIKGDILTSPGRKYFRRDVDARIDETLQETEKSLMYLGERIATFRRFVLRGHPNGPQLTEDNIDHLAEHYLAQIEAN